MPRSTSSVQAKKTPKKASKLASKKANKVVKKKVTLPKKKPSVKTIKPSQVIAKAKETIEKVTTQKEDYSAAQIQVLEGLEPVRKRPGMYIGSTDVTGLHETLREIIDNGVDEALAGYAKNVWIVIKKALLKL